MPAPGELYDYPDYVFPDHDQRNKYVLVMGKTRADDWILVRTTSQQHGRSINPLCYLGDPYPGFFINTANGLLQHPTWLALNRLDDHDTREFDAKIAVRAIILVGKLPADIFCQALDCASRAQDTTREQENAMRDLRAKLGCR